MPSGVYERSEAEKLRFKRLNIGRKQSPEWRRKVAIASANRFQSPEKGEKCRLANLGRKATPETIEKLRKSHIGKHLRDKHPNWKGGVNKSRGYRGIYIDKDKRTRGLKYIPEHRLVMEKQLGRQLESIEVIHHINEVKADNRFENLMLFPSQKEHLAYHRKLKRESN